MNLQLHSSHINTMPSSIIQHLHHKSDKCSPESWSVCFNNPHMKMIWKHRASPSLAESHPFVSVLQVPESSHITYGDVSCYSANISRITTPLSIHCKCNTHTEYLSLVNGGKRRGTSQRKSVTEYILIKDEVLLMSFITSDMP